MIDPPAVTDRWGQFLKPGVKVQHHGPKRAPAWFGEVVSFNHGWVSVKALRQWPHGYHQANPY
jgi:hypothetical protein